MASSFDSVVRPLLGLIVWGACESGIGRPTRAFEASDDGQGWSVGRPYLLEADPHGGDWVLPACSRALPVLMIVSRLDDPDLIDQRERRLCSATHHWTIRSRSAPGVTTTKPTPLQATPIRDVPVRPFVRLNTTPPNRNPPPSRRTFSLRVRHGDPSSPSNYRTIHSELVGHGRRVQVYADRIDRSGLDRDWIAQVISTVDNDIETHLVGRWGRALDVDGDGRLTVLATRWLNRMGSGRYRVDGFVRAADFDRRIASPLGNRCDLITLNPDMSAGDYLRTVLVHEYAHAVNASAKLMGVDPSRPNEGASEVAWLDEAIAHVTEDLVGATRANLDYRVAAFLNDPSRFALRVPDYYEAGFFRSAGHRGATYLFLRWCVDRFGLELVDRLILSQDVGTANLEASTGSSFETLFRLWSLALFFDGYRPDDEPEGCFPSWDLRDAEAAWPLAGPQLLEVQPGADLTIPWVPSAPRFLLIRTRADTPTRIKLIDEAQGGDVQGSLQVTAVALPYDPQPLRLRVRQLGRALDSDSISSSRPTTRVTIRLQPERAVGPLRLILSSTRPSPRQPDPFWTTLDGAFDAARGRRTFAWQREPSQLEADGTSEPLRYSTLGPEGSPPLIKAVGVDSEGYRITAWTTLE